jgi:DnaJ-class molecular chaperone
VSRDADARSIRRAYRRAAAKWHPDKWTTRSEAERSAAAAAFRRVAGAYEALGDAKRRRAYDADPESFPLE